MSQYPDTESREEDKPAAFFGLSAVSACSLLFLTLIATINYLDRHLLSLVLPLIKEEMVVSDTALGLVSGLAFVLMYSVAGVPIASLADRWNRRNIIAVGLTFWSLMVFCTAFVTDIWQLAFLRLLMGAGEATCLAPAQSMLADRFRPERRAFALSVFNGSSALSQIAFLPIMGLIAQEHGWRAAFIAAGVPGMLLAAIFLLVVKEPPRGQMDEGKPVQEAISFKTAARHLARIATYVTLFFGFSIYMININAHSAWDTTFLVRVHEMSISEVSSIIGPIKGGLGVVGALAGGFLVDRLGQRDPRWRLWIPGIACLLLLPAEAAFLLGEGALFHVGLVATSLLNFLFVGAIYAVILNVVPIRVRALAISIVVMTAALVGQVIGPFVVGYLNDLYHPTLGEEAIRYSLLIIVVSAFAAGALFFLAARTMQADSARSEDLQRR